MIDYNDANPLFLKHLDQLRDEKWYKLEHIGGIYFQDQCIAHLLTEILNKEGIEAKVTSKIMRQSLYELENPSGSDAVLKENRNYFVQWGDQVFSPMLGKTGSLDEMNAWVLEHEEQQSLRINFNQGSKRSSAFDYTDDEGINPEHTDQVGMDEKARRYGPVLMACLRKTPLFEQEPQMAPVINVGDDALTFLPEDLRKRSLLKPDQEENIHAILLRRLQNIGYDAKMFQRTSLVEQNGSWVGTERKVIQIEGVEPLIALGQPNDLRKRTIYNEALVERLWGRTHAYDLKQGSITAMTEKTPALRRFISTLPPDQQDLQDSLFAELVSFAESHLNQDNTVHLSARRMGSRY